MSRFILHTKSRERLTCLVIGLAGLMVVGIAGLAVHSVGTARAKSREVVAIYTEEEFQHYLLDEESEEYNLRGRYRLEENLDLSWMEQSVGTNVEPFQGSLDGNGHVISGLERPLFGVMEKAEVENLLFREAEIRHPFTYYDGEYYTDGYGALAAYAIDSVIRNCGVNGEIVTSYPVEAEYMIAKASPGDADEMVGPGAVESFDVPETGGESLPDSAQDGAGENVDGGNGAGGGPGIESGETGDGESGAENGTQESAGPGVESSIQESAEPGMESSLQESGKTEVETDFHESVDSEIETSQQEVQEPEAETSPQESGDGETENNSQSSQENPKPDQGDAADESSEDSSKPETDNSTGAGAETNAQAPEHSDSVPSHTTSATHVDNVQAAAETVGYLPIDRQLLMLRVSVVMDADAESAAIASPSDATPSDAEEVSSGNTIASGNGSDSNAPDQEDEGDGLKYIGNPNGDICILVTAERIAAGGLLAQTAGETLVSDSFTLVTIGSSLGGMETKTGGLAGILGENTRTENSYAAGLVDSDDITGGFAAVNEGIIRNCYSIVTVGEAGTVRGAFTASGNGILSGCVYDRQMACADGGEEELETETASPSEAEEMTEFSLKGLNTIEMAALESQIPGNWYTAEMAYPQLSYFAMHEEEELVTASKVSVIPLVLPDGYTLADAVREDEMQLPTQIDGQEISWKAEEGLAIHPGNQTAGE